MLRSNNRVYAGTESQLLLATRVLDDISNTATAIQQISLYQQKINEIRNHPAVGNDLETCEDKVREMVRMVILHACFNHLATHYPTTDTALQQAYGALVSHSHNMTVPFSFEHSASQQINNHIANINEYCGSSISYVRDLLEKINQATREAIQFAQTLRVGKLTLGQCFKIDELIQKNTANQLSAQNFATQPLLQAMSALDGSENAQDLMRNLRDWSNQYTALKQRALDIQKAAKTSLQAHYRGQPSPRPTPKQIDEGVEKAFDTRYGSKPCNLELRLSERLLVNDVRAMTFEKPSSHRQLIF